MGQPTPPGDIPLYEGLGVEWNDIVGAFPEDKRAELAPKLKERLSSYEALKPWETLNKAGVTPQYVDTALNVYSILERNPKEVYETLGNYLGISKAEAKEVIKDIKEGNIDPEEDPRIATLTQQVETLTQLALAKRNQEKEAQDAAEADAALEKEMSSLKKKYGEVDEEQVIMRMVHKNLTAEQAYLEYVNRDNEIRKRRLAPMVMGAGGQVPPRAIDPTKLSSADTKNLVAQMLEHGNANR